MLSPLMVLQLLGGVPPWVVAEIERREGAMVQVRTTYVLDDATARRATKVGVLEHAAPEAPKLSAATAERVLHIVSDALDIPVARVPREYDVIVYLNPSTTTGNVLVIPKPRAPLPVEPSRATTRWQQFCEWLGRFLPCG